MEEPEPGDFDDAALNSWGSDFTIDGDSPSQTVVVQPMVHREDPQ